jgi:hypothetical protein
MSAGVLSESGGKLEGAFAAAGNRLIWSPGENFVILVARLAPAFREVGNFSGLEVFGKEDGGVFFDALIARVFRGKAWTFGECGGGRGCDEEEGREIHSNENASVVTIVWQSIS